MESSGKSINSPVPGKVIEIQAKTGNEVKRGDLLLIVEAMKMYNKILAPFNGVIKEVNVTLGQAVNTNAPLVIIDMI